MIFFIEYKYPRSSPGMEYILINDIQGDGTDDRARDLIRLSIWETLQYPR